MRKGVGGACMGVRVRAAGAGWRVGRMGGARRRWWAC